MDLYLLCSFPFVSPEFALGVNVSFSITLKREGVLPPLLFYSDDSKAGETRQQQPPQQRVGARKSAAGGGEGWMAEPLLSFRYSVWVIRFHSHHNPADEPGDESLVPLEDLRPIDHFPRCVSFPGALRREPGRGACLGGTGPPDLDILFFLSSTDVFTSEVLIHVGGELRHKTHDPPKGEESGVLGTVNYEPESLEAP